MHAASNIICTLLYVSTDPVIYRLQNFSLTLNVLNTACHPKIDANKFITFNLYTRKNPLRPQILQSGNDRTLRSSNIDFRKRTYIFVHGFTESIHADDSQVMKNYLLINGDHNVIIVNAEKLLAGIDYIVASLNTRYVGKIIGNLIDYLVKKGLQLADLHVIGFSLGAHIMGFAGNYVTSGRLPRITGLDPAGPLFYFNSPDDRLDSTDADFVDIIHTSQYIYGYVKPMGHIDFYPNGGGPFQPGCSLLKRIRNGSLNEFVFCDHYRAFRLYAKSMVQPTRYKARQCSSYDLYLQGNCSTHPVAYMGFAVSKEDRGVFYIDTGTDAEDIM